MENLKIVGSSTNMVECEGHPSLVFDNNTNVCVVLYLNIITKDDIKHPFTLLITDEDRVNDAIEYLKKSYIDNYANIEYIAKFQLKPNL